MHSELIRQTPVFILCGGLGTRLREETQFRPKPMVPIGGKPILLHIMRWYAKFGFRRFILCLGFKGEQIKEYFLNYHALESDATVHLQTNHTTTHRVCHTDDWEVTLADTGGEAMTGGRLWQAAQRYLDRAPMAAVTYGDGLCNVDLEKQMGFHLEHGHLGTVLGVHPPSRFGELHLKGDCVSCFEEKPLFSNQWINGGYYFFHRSFFTDYLTEEGSLEHHPLAQLAADGQLRAYRHQGKNITPFWACMDTQRDREYLESLARPPWDPAAPAAEPTWLEKKLGLEKRPEIEEKLDFHRRQPA